MAMTDTAKDFIGLEVFFQAATAEAPEVSDDLMARIFGDADAVQAERLRPATPLPPAKVGLWHSLVDMLGGRAALAGLATATVMGAFLGFAQPAPLAPFAQSVTQSVLGETSSLGAIDLLPTADTVLTEG
ncbi:hypothetical protein GALL_514360 [mine drainage metagenome]|uniref:Dihydroorotate dehydrogenase n=1 Tax=mine drainage metagenome TaxID=410659 RepID=A0A1J5P703_9ZZZZ